MKCQVYTTVPEVDENNNTIREVQMKCRNQANYKCSGGMYYCSKHKKPHGPDENHHTWTRLDKKK